MPIAVSGSVLDERGKAIGEARVSFASAPVAVPDIAALTDERGAFTLSAPIPGRYTLAVAADGFAAANAEVTLGKTAATLIVRLHRE